MEISRVCRFLGVWGAIRDIASRCRGCLFVEKQETFYGVRVASPSNKYPPIHDLPDYRISGFREILRTHGVRLDPGIDAPGFLEQHLHFRDVIAAKSRRDDADVDVAVRARLAFRLGAEDDHRVYLDIVALQKRPKRPGHGYYIFRKCVFNHTMNCSACNRYFSVYSRVAIL